MAPVDNFDRNFALLKRYAAEHGHPNVPHAVIYHDVKLGVWCATVRRRRELGRVPPEQVKLLTDLGLYWNKRKDRSDEAYRSLLPYLRAYIAEHGHADVPQQFQVGVVRLGRWVNFLRRMYTLGRLSPTKIEELESLGFVWQAHNHRLDRFFQVLERFIAEHGHPNVPQSHVIDGVEIGRWCTWQRKQYRKGKVPAERVLRLEALGFLWEPGRSLRESQLSEPLAMLQQFRDEFGHLDVPAKYVTDGYWLGAWCTRQRTRRRRGSLPAAHIRQLDALGFIWEPLQLPSKALEKSISRHVEMLKRYQAEHGHLNVPSRFVMDGFRLGHWCAEQRKRRKHGIMGSARFVELNELGFVWDPLKQLVTDRSTRTDDQRPSAFDQRYALLVEYVEQHGDSNVPNEFRVAGNGFCLGKWCTRQRARYRLGALPEAAIQNFEAIGFQWNPKRVGRRDSTR